jgi:hypothetical protein
MHHPKRLGGALALGLVLALTSSCKRAEAPPPVAPVPAPAPAVVPFGVKSVQLGSSIGPDKRVPTPMSTFAKGDTIYASVATDGAAPTVTLSARWTYGDGQPVNESSETISPTGPAVTEFHISKPDGWPAGSYKVEIRANGAVLGSQQFTVAE